MRFQYERVSPIYTSQLPFQCRIGGVEEGDGNTVVPFGYNGDESEYMVVNEIFFFLISIFL